jgi:hypothetical protein
MITSPPSLDIDDRHSIDSLAQIQILTSNNQDINLSEFINNWQGNEYQPFDDRFIQILNQLSRIILKNPVLRKDAGSVSLAYWLRTAGVRQIKDRFDRLESLDEQILRVPVGRVFHIAPSNVDTMFVYSWAISFLCGNANIVRVSGQKSSIATALIECIDSVMPTEPILRDNNLFITYPHNPAITTLLSSWCSHRTIWGGDNTAASVRPLPLNPHASERIFASKFSYSAINAKYFAIQDVQVLTDVADRFYNDIFWFDQMACSSPHIIFWVGEQEIVDRSIHRFNVALAEIVKNRNYQPSTSNAVKRLNHTFDLAVNKASTVSLEHIGFISIHLDRLQDLDKETCGGGLLKHVRIDRLSDMAAFASDRDQTISHYGFEVTELKQLARIVGAKGVDRIIPVGEALAFSTHWDGYNLISDFTREVVVY